MNVCLSVPDKRVPALLHHAKALSAEMVAKNEAGVAESIDLWATALAAAVPNAARRRLVTISLPERYGIMLVVDRIAETTTASAKHWAERARSKLVSTDHATTTRVTL